MCHLPMVVSTALHVYTQEVSIMPVLVLTAELRTIAKMIVMMTREKMHVRAIFR
jgi:hypothetical protein